MHRQTTKHIRHTKGTHFSGGLVIILLAGVGSHENSTLLFPVGCEFTSKVRPYSTPRAWRNAPIDFSHVIETDVRTDVLFAHALPKRHISVLALLPGWFYGSTMKLNAKRGAVVLFIGVTLIVLRCTSFCGDLQILTQLKLPEDGEHNTPPWTHFNHNFIHHYFIGNQSTYPPKIVPSRNHNSGVASTPGLAALTSERFIITQEFKFPHPKTMELINVIEQSNWIQELRSILLKWQGKRQIAVSYTHLTLPTIYSV